MPSPLQTYQDDMIRNLQQLYHAPIPVLKEWRAITNISGLYCPRIDIAVGPFSVRRGGNCISEYDQLMNNTRGFIDQLLIHHQDNITRFHGNVNVSSFTTLRDHNRNARCLLAIEIENKVSRKHLLGGAVNAAALGRIGIAIGWNTEEVKAFVKLREYWDFLASVGKNTFNTANLLILTPEQFRTAIETACRTVEVPTVPS